MLKRIIAAVCALGLVLPVLFLGGQLGAEILLAAVTVLVLWEYAPFCNADDRVRTFGVLLLAGLGLFAVMCWAPHGWTTASLVLGMFLVLTWSMLSQDTPETSAKMGSMMAFGLIYIPLPLAILTKLRAMDQGLALVLMVLVCTWAADTGAYFAGRFLGKAKLLPRISPKKTWAGVWGGVALSIACAIGMAAGGYPEMPLGLAAGIGALVSVVGVVGDLIESMFKRSSGIKDSGGIMPGHGGLLDRVDSLLFTIPVAWIVLRLAGMS
jgi:phosphatidate cytidylyltransferase